MYVAYGLAIVRLPGIGRDKKGSLLEGFLNRGSSNVTQLDLEHDFKRRQVILNRFGLSLEGLEPSKVDLHLDMNSQNELVIMPMDDNREMWLGWSISAIQDQLLSVWDLPLPDFDASIFTLDFENPFFTYQHIKDGALGSGALNSSKKAWQRGFKHNGYTPKLTEKDIAIEKITEELEADVGLVKRVIYGMKGRGFYGMAFHPEKQAWVMARSLADDANTPPEMFHELNPNSYKKKGKPVDIGTHAKSGLSFLSQQTLFLKMVQDIIWQIFGFRVNYGDGEPYDQQFANRECLRGKIAKL